MSKCQLTEENKKEIIKKYTSEPYTCAALGRQYGVHTERITTLLRKAGVKVRNDLSKLRRKYTLNENYFKIIDCEEKAYFLGLLYADGCNYPKANVVKLSLQERDVDIINKFKESIQYKKPIRTCYANQKRNINSQPQCVLELTSKILCNDLSELGCVPNKSLILTFPNKNQVPNKFIRHFIRGYFDGDGSLYFQQKSDYAPTAGISIVSTKPFCEYCMRFIYNQTGIKFSLCNKKSKNNKTYGLFINGARNSIKFLNWLYKDSSVWLQRKYNKYITLKEIRNSLGLSNNL